MLQIITAALLSALTFTIMAAPTENFTRRKMASLAEIDKAIAVANLAERPAEYRLRGEPPR